MEEGGQLIRIPLRGINSEKIAGDREAAKLQNGRWTYPLHVQKIEELIPVRSDYLFHVSEGDYYTGPTMEEAMAAALHIKAIAAKRPGLAANKKMIARPVESIAKDLLEAGEKHKLFNPASLLVRIAHVRTLLNKARGG